MNLTGRQALKSHSKVRRGSWPPRIHLIGPNTLYYDGETFNYAPTAADLVALDWEFFTD